MGQTQLQGVRDIFPEQMSVVTDRLILRATEIKRLAKFSYDQLQESVAALNELTEAMADSSGKKLVFQIKEGTDSTVLWRATVKIRCTKVASQTGDVECVKLLTLKQFMRVYNAVMCQASIRSSSGGVTRLNHPGPDNSLADRDCSLDASVLLMQIDAACGGLDHEDNECIICMDQQAAVILPCTHSYCEKCIDAWQGSHRTCPVCRASVENSKDSWVLSEKPDEQEMASEACSYVMGLIDRQPTDTDSSD